MMKPQAFHAEPPPGHSWSSWLGLALGLALALPVAAETGATARTALIIGISHYQDPAVPALEGVPFDIESARRIADAMGVPPSNVEVLRDEQATKPRILQALRELGQRSPEGTRTLVYFSGHGTRWADPQSGECVEGLLTYERSAIVKREMAAVSAPLMRKADKVITMLDACFSLGVTGTTPLARSMGPAFTPKFSWRADGDASRCGKPSNMHSRSLTLEQTRLGALQENVVEITSSRSDEVSFDEPGKGGLATQAVRDCLLGEARSGNGAGAVTMADVEQCAQRLIDDKVSRMRDSNLSAHHVTVIGSRNLIPVPVQPAEPVHATAPVPPPASTPGPAPQIAQQLPQQVVPPPPGPAPSARPPQAEPQAPPAAAPAPVLASLSTLQLLAQQGNPRRSPEVTVDRHELRIGHDALNLKVKAHHDGFVYLLMLGSDSRSFYLLFPNGLDADNHIAAGQTLRLPRPDWQVQAAGPGGDDQLLVLVSDTPRRLESLRLSPAGSGSPFTYTLNDFPGRASLLNYLTGQGRSGSSESFGTRLVTLKELP
ncbi:MAG: caspase family protein [Curvibacter sp.]|nr:caspase family protein [Curvibacter sp.]